MNGEESWLVEGADVLGGEFNTTSTTTTLSRMPWKLLYKIVEWKRNTIRGGGEVKWQFVLFNGHQISIDQWVAITITAIFTANVAKKLPPNKKVNLSLFSPQTKLLNNVNPKSTHQLTFNSLSLHLNLLHFVTCVCCIDCIDLMILLFANHLSD